MAVVKGPSGKSNAGHSSGPHNETGAAKGATKSYDKAGTRTAGKQPSAGGSVRRVGTVTKP